MKFSELQRLQRREGITVLSSDARIEQLEARLCTITKERDALRAKVAAMEKQEPVGEIQRANSTGNYICSEVWVPLPVGSKLYALPGAKGEEK